MSLQDRVNALRKKYKDEPEQPKSSFPAFLAVYGMIKMKHPDKENVQAEMACPVCEKGIVTYSISGSNGHVWARCSTDGCVRFMQ